MTSNNEKKLLTKSDINRVFWQILTINIANINTANSNLSTTIRQIVKTI